MNMYKNKIRHGMQQGTHLPLPPAKKNKTKTKKQKQNQRQNLKRIYKKNLDLTQKLLQHNQQQMEKHK